MSYILYRAVSSFFVFLIHGHDRCEYNPKVEKFTIQLHGPIHEYLVALTTATSRAGYEILWATSSIKSSLSALSWKTLHPPTRPMFIPWHALDTFDHQTSKSCVSDARFHESLSRSHIRRSFAICMKLLLMTEGNILMVIGIDIGYNLKDGIIADRLLVWEPVELPGSPPSLSSVSDWNACRSSGDPDSRIPSFPPPSTYPLKLLLLKLY